MLARLGTSKSSASQIWVKTGRTEYVCCTGSFLSNSLWLQRVARVDLTSPLNSAHVPVSYTPVERLLTHLEAITGILPASYDRHQEMYRCASLLV